MKKAKTRPPGAIEIQISATVHQPAGTTIGRDVIRQAIDYKIENGEDPPGIELRIVRWRHKRDGDWTDSQEEQREWQKFGRLLHHARVQVRAHGDFESEE